MVFIFWLGNGLKNETMCSENDHREAWLSAKGWELLLWAVISGYFCLILILSLSYHWGYLSTMADVGTFDQAVWGILNGEPFLNTSIFSTPINFLGVHFKPILLCFIPFYAVLPAVEWMILAQSIALAITAWPIYLLGIRVFNVKAAAFLFALTYLVNPFVLSVPPWVFRPESLVLPFIAFSMLGIEKGNWGLTLLSCFVILLCKEHFGIMVCGIGILWWLRNKDFKGAFVLFLFGLLHVTLVLSVIMPIFSPTGKHLMITGNLGQLSRYAWLGSSGTEIIRTVLTHPLSVLKIVICDMGGKTYFIALLLPFLGLPLAGIEFLLLPGLADFAANTLSANPMPRSIFAYHSVTIIPIITAAAIYGTKRISILTERNRLINMLGAAILITNLLLGYFFSPLPLAGAINYWAPTQLINNIDPDIEKVQSVLPENYSVSVQANVGAHFSQRHEIYVYPNKIKEVDAVILRLMSPTQKVEMNHDYPPELQKSITGSLDAHLQMNRNEYIRSIEQLLEGDKYGVLLWQDPWLVLSRKFQDEKDLSNIKSKLEELRIEWKVDN